MARVPGLLCPLVIALCAMACDPKLSVVSDGKLDASPPPATERRDADPAPPITPPPMIMPPADAGTRADVVTSAPGSACAGGDVAPPTPCATLGVVIDPVYAANYSCFDLGSVPGLPMQKYGGLLLTRETCSTNLLILGEANFATGKLYSIKVKRDRLGQIAGFEGTATPVADAPYNDGGIAYHPDGVLFLARWPSNQLQQTKPGSMLADKVISLMELGVAHSSAAIGFVPARLPGPGTFKLMTWPGGQWHTIGLKADGAGTFDISDVKKGPVLAGGPEGFVYVEAGSPNFATHAMLVSEWSANQIATYEIDEQSDPKMATRKTFITGFTGPEGAYRDPATGDFFFSTWGQMADRVIVVRGFRPIVID